MKTIPRIDIPGFVDDLDRVIEKHFPTGKLLSFSLRRDARPFLCFLHVTATYIFMRANTVLYVGVSGDVGSRLKSHLGKSTSESGREASRLLLVPMNSWEEAAHLEAVLINRWRPKYNRTIPLLSCGPYEGNRSDMQQLARAIESKLGIEKERA